MNIKQNTRFEAKIGQKMAMFLKKKFQKWVEKQCFDVIKAWVRQGEIFFTL